MDDDDKKRLSQIARQLGYSVTDIDSVSGGYTPALRARLTFTDGQRGFIKVATDSDTARWLNDELITYRALQDAPFVPQILAAEELDGFPVMILEDLRDDAHWPPPWRPGDVDRVLERLDQVAKWPVPQHLSHMTKSEEGSFEGWASIAQDSAPFLSLGLCDEPWLTHALPTLLEAEAANPHHGDELVHLDVRSDNLCLHPERGVILIDWNWAARGVGLYDVAFWLPSLALEGGPMPWEILPHAGPIAAVVSGYFCSQAGKDPLPKAPGVRPFQRKQASVALPWAARALDLPPPSSQRALR